MDEAAFEALMKEYSTRVFNIAFRIIGHRQEAEDAVQEIFYQAYKSFKNFRDESSPYTWLYRIAVRTAMREKRKIQPGETESIFSSADHFAEDIPEEVERWRSNPEESALYNELIRQVREGCLHFMSFRLTPEQRSIYMLRYVLDFSYQEISDIMEIPMSSVKARLNRIKKKIQSFFENNCQWLCSKEERQNSEGLCSCDRKIGIALSLKPDLLRNVKAAALEHDPSSPVGSIMTEAYPDIHHMYSNLRVANYDPEHLRSILKR